MPYLSTRSGLLGVVALGALPLFVGSGCSDSDFSAGQDAGNSGEGASDSGGKGGAVSGGSSGRGGSKAAGGTSGGEAGETNQGSGGTPGGKGGTTAQGTGGSADAGADGGSSDVGGDAGMPGGGDGGKGGAQPGTGGADGGSSGTAASTGGKGGNAGAPGAGGDAGMNSSGGTGGASGTGGTSGAGAGGTGGSSGTGGSGGSGGLPATCSLQTGTSDTKNVYTGIASGSACSNYIDPPRSGLWRASTDGTATPTAIGILGGRAGLSDCAMHNTGGGLTDWGGGMAFGFNMSTNAFCRYDASAYTGVRMYIRGTAVGSAGNPAGAASDNTVRVTVATTETASVDEGGSCVPNGSQTCNDHFAKYCVFASDWTLCDLPLAHPPLNQFGFGAAKTFNKANLVEITFEVHRASASPSVSFDYEVDDIAFY